MAKRGMPSVAHVYDRVGQCIYCGMYESVVVKLAHVCTVKRESEVDSLEKKGKKDGK